MRITVVGCAGTYAAGGDACSGYLVQSDGISVLLDAGAGVVSALQRHLPLTSLDAVVLSHSHPDHWVDAPVLRNALRYVLGHSGVRLIAPGEVLEMVATVARDRLEPTFRAEVVTDGDEMRIGGLTVRCSRTDHPPETLAFGFDDGRHRFAYSADTGPGWSVAELGRDIDLVVCEATFREGEVSDGETPVHLTAAQAGAGARAAGARRLVITHLVPGADADGARTEAEDAYGAAVGVARPGLVLDT